MDKPTIVAILENGMKVLQDDGDTLLVVCAETDELCVLKQVKSVKDFGMKWRGKLFEVTENFSASYVFGQLGDAL